VLWQELQNKQILVTPNISLYRWESDLIGVTGAGFCHEYEIKISKSDFKVDAKKSKHWYLKKGMQCCNYFWYVCPENMVSKEDVPDHAGLIYIVPNKYNTRRQTGYGTFCKPTETFVIVKQAPRLHAGKISDKHKEYLSRGLMLRYWSQRVKDSK
jgi:hypothetical protein